LAEIVHKIQRVWGRGEKKHRWALKNREKKVQPSLKWGKENLRLNKKSMDVAKYSYVFSS